MQPFSKIDISKFIAEQHQKIKCEIEIMSNDILSANPIERIIDNLVEKYEIMPVEILEECQEEREIKQVKVRRRIDPFFRDNYNREFVDVDVDVDGYAVSFKYPFEGNKILFSCRASTYSLSGYKDIELLDSFFLLVYEVAAQQFNEKNGIEKLLTESNRDLENIKKGIEYANNDISNYNSGLYKIIENNLNNKKKYISQFNEVKNFLNIPIEKKSNVPLHQLLKIEKKPLKLSNEVPVEDQYLINDSIYLDINEAIKHTCATFERTPNTYTMLGEEDLRNIILSNLNTSFEGKANGEVFRKGGKTDICIEFNNRSAFIAECKLWKGKKSFTDAISQLLGYLTWRDCKTTLIMLNKHNKDFLKILNMLEQIIKEHQKYVRIEKKQEINEYTCIFRSKDDDCNYIKINIMLFNIYSIDQSI